MGSKKTFTPEFKQESASLVINGGYTVSQACDAMGVSKSAMARWVKQLKAEQAGETIQGAQAITKDKQEIQRLNKQIKKLEREKEILKKASALLMMDGYRSTC